MSNIHIHDQQITETLEKNYMPYAMSVIISRAIPEIDGLKPSHRKLLYTMYKMGLLGSNRTKSANVVGQTMKLNPHGDLAIYDTLVRLTRGNQALLHPLIDSKGNFGKQYSRDMACAAPRYTEVKLDEVSNELFKDIDKNTVDFIDNYDGTMKEPLLLPVSFPNILVNPNQGIAVGMASSICSFNLKEVCEATIAIMKNPDTDINEHLKAPDFSTGGELLYNKSEMEAIYRAGRGSFKVRSKWRFDKKNSCIEIYEIPYTTTSEAIIDKIIEAVKLGKVKEISDVRDETDLSGLKITIDIKRNVDPEMLMARLFRITPLEDSFSCNFNLLINGAPRTMGIAEILKEWSIFRINCVRRRLQTEILEKSDKLHLLEGLQKILLDIDKAIHIVRHTEEDKLVIPNLMDGFKIDQVQAEYVAEIRLRNLNKEYILKRIAEVEGLRADIERLSKILSDEKEIKKLITDELKQIIKKYGQERKTGIIDMSEVEEVKIEQFVEDYNLKLFMTRDNYLKKISLVSLRASAEHKLKAEDEIICECDASNRDDLLLFSSVGDCYKMRISEIPDCKASVLGEYLPNLLGMAEGEKIVYIVPTSDYKGHLIFGFENGKVAKVEMESYATKTNRRKLTGGYNTLSPLVFIDYTLTDADYAIYGKDRALVFNTAEIAPKSARTTQGVQVYLSKRDKFVQRMCKAEKSDLGDTQYYFSKKIPASGVKLKEEDGDFVQLKLD